MPESIGQRLKQAREARRLSIEEASNATHIRPHYLQALENDDFSVMPSAAQGRGFLRIYADFLDLSVDEIVANARQARPVSADATASSASPAPQPEAPPAPVTPAEPLPASRPDQKPGRPGFWSRLLRRSAPAATPEAESTPPVEVEPAAPVVREPEIVVSAPAMDEEQAVEPVKPARKASTPRKTKPVASAVSEERSKTARRSSAGKKKT